jgi:hypothetical protein
MCFSPEASIISFLFGIIGSILVFTLGGDSNKIIALFLGFVSSMQFIEYLLWNHQKCDLYNRLLSNLGMWLNHLQPIILGILVLIFNKNLAYFYGIIGVLVVYLCIIIPYSLQFWKTNIIQCTLKNVKTKHLLWNWNGLNYSTIVYLLFLFTMVCLFIYGLPNKILGIISAIVAVFTFGSSKIIYPQKFVGAMWCFYTAFIPIIYYIIYKLYLYKYDEEDRDEENNNTDSIENKIK